MNRRRFLLIWGWTALGELTLLIGSRAENLKSSTEPIKIGVVNSLFRDVPKPLAVLAMQPFRELMQAQTGLSGQIKEVGSPEALGQQLFDDEVQVGIFHGIE